MKKIWRTGRSYLIFIALMLAETAAAAFIDRTFFLISLSVTSVCAVAAVIELIRLQNRLESILNSAGRAFTTPESKALYRLRIPVLITSVQNEVIWYNRAFSSAVGTAKESLGKSIFEFIPDLDVEKLALSGHVEVTVGDKIFSVFASSQDTAEAPLLYYFFDQTKLKKISREYNLSRPVVMILSFDGIYELTKNLKDSEAAAFKSKVQTVIEKWAAGSEGICRRMSGDKYLIVIEERRYTDLEQGNFSLLGDVRAVKTDDISGATISIGIGRGAHTLADAEKLAEQALDMAQGRGGDQAVVKMESGEFKFFGGVSGAIEKSSKVRTRIVATALKKLMENSEQILIMGHKFGDLDSIGAAFGLYSAAKTLGKEAYIVANTELSLAQPLCEMIQNYDPYAITYDIEGIVPQIGKHTLLCIVDVHRPSFLESAEIYDACENIVIIDHHRKVADHIDNSIIFYNETSASSSCEMVTELIQYMDQKAVAKPQAEALLSGIMLDTKNFVFNTGVRTFEAAAYLKNRGADTVNVKKLFAASANLYRQRANIITTAAIWNGCAIAVNSENDGDTRLASAQAADELLGIGNVTASFVIYRSDGILNVSARSLGEMNVQLVMEQLGGGGHRTMAACQLDNMSFDEAIEKLKSAVIVVKNMNPTGGEKAK